MSTSVHWHEGLFLQPHHLQAMQGSVDAKLGFERELGQAYPHGVVESRLDMDALANGKVRFEKLVAVLPGGRIVDHPNGADLPALDIEQAFAASPRGLRILLGVPAYDASRANTIDLGEDADWRVKRLWRVIEQDRKDENTGENAQPVLHRRVNARLMLDTDDRTGIEAMPLVRVVHAAGEVAGQPVSDEGYAPPCLVLAGSGVLRELVRDLANRVEAARKETRDLLVRGGFNPSSPRPTDPMAMMRLMVLNRFAGRLPSIAQAAVGVSPLAAYLELRDLQGGLAALSPNDDAFDAPAYDHDDPLGAFKAIAEAIRTMLGDAGPRLPMDTVPFTGEPATVAFEEKHLAGSEFYLEVRTREDPRALVALVEDKDKFKLMATSFVKAGRDFFGVVLAEERDPPAAFPSGGGVRYFRIERHQRTSKLMWERITQEKSATIVHPPNWAGKLDEMKVRIVHAE